MNTDSKVSLIATPVGRRDARPPLSYLLVDVTISNQEDSPRWFLLPRRLDKAPLAQGGTDGVEPYVLPGSGRVILGIFQGNGGFQAVYVPGGGRITIRSLTVDDWDSAAPNPRRLVALVTTELRIGTEEARAWFPEDPLSAPAADVHDDHSMPLRPRHTEDRSELAIHATNAQTLRVELTVP